MNILIADADVGNDIEEPLRQEYLKYGKVVNRIEFRSSRSLILQHLEAYPDTDVAIIAQYQGKNMIKASEVDTISTMSDHLRVILVVNEERGSEYMKELEANGIYHALFSEDASMEEVVKLSIEGRSKREARQYYGVTGSDALQAKESFSAQGSVKYICGYDGSMEDLAGRLAYVSDRVPGNTEFVEVLQSLPKEVFERVSRLESYTALCGFIDENRRYQMTEKKETCIQDKNSGREGKSTRKGIFHRKKDRKVGAEESAENHQAGSDFLNRSVNREVAYGEGKRKTSDVGFISITPGAGCTTSAIMFAHSMMRSLKNQRIAIVEFDQEDECFETLCRLALEEANPEGLKSFSLGGVDYYFHIPYSRFVTEKKPIYDLVIYDFGAADNDTIEEYVRRMSTVFVVGSAKEWHYGVFLEYIREVAPLDVNDSFIYLFSSVEEKQDLGSLQGLIPKKNIYAAIPYEANPFAPSKETCRIFYQLFSGKYTPKLQKKYLEIGEKVTHVTAPKWKRMCIYWGMFWIFSMIFMGAGFTYMGIRYAREIRQITEDQLDLQKKYDILTAEKTSLQNTLTSLEHTALIPTKDIAPGDVIDEYNTKLETVKMELKGDVLLGEEQMGKRVAAMAIRKDIPIFYDMTAKQVDEQIPAPAEELFETEEQEGTE